MLGRLRRLPCSGAWSRGDPRATSARGPDTAPRPAPAPRHGRHRHEGATAATEADSSPAEEPIGRTEAPPPRSPRKPPATARLQPAAPQSRPIPPPRRRQTASADAPLRDAYHQAPRDTVSQDVYDGWKQFNLNCARCHGEDVTGTTIAPHLIVSLKPDGPINTKELFVSTVCSGRPGRACPRGARSGLGDGQDPGDLLLRERTERWQACAGPPSGQSQG